MTDPAQPLRILLHAPSAAALARARSNAANLLKQSDPVQVHIVVNAEAVEAVLDEPNKAADPITLVCPNTLERLGRRAPPPLTVPDQGAVLLIARMQAQGWFYIRA